jgi:cobalt-zinc-cadmium efflux system outer membrane protein
LPSKFEEPAGVITLSQALSVALAKSPELEAFSWDVRAAEARALQAGLLPNPELEVEAGEFGGSGPLRDDEAVEATVSLAQLVELGGKRGARMNLAGFERDLAGWDYEAARLDVLTATTRAFVGLLAAQRRRDLAEESVGLATAVLETVSARVAAGKVSPLEKTKAEVGRSLEQITLQSAERELDAARSSLAASWGSTTAAFERAEGAFETISRVPAFAVLSALILQNPDLERWVVEIESRKAGVELEEANRWPDLTISGGATRFEEGTGSEHAFSAGISIPLPLFDRNTGGVLEANALLAKAEAARRAALARVHVDLTGSYAGLSSSHAAANALRDSILPGARRVFDSASEGYRTGKLGFLDVLDAQRTLLDARSQYIDVLETYHKTTADVERLVGQALSSTAPASSAEEHSDD